jgi:hypothetical protein
MSSDFDINLLAISSPSFRITPRPRYPEIAVARTRRLFRSFFDPHASSLEMSGSPRQLPSNQRMSRRPRHCVPARRPGHRGLVPDGARRGRLGGCAGPRGAVFEGVGLRAAQAAPGHPQDRHRASLCVLPRPGLFRTQQPDQAEGSRGLPAGARPMSRLPAIRARLSPSPRRQPAARRRLWLLRGPRPPSRLRASARG